MHTVKQRKLSNVNGRHVFFSTKLINWYHFFVTLILSTVLNLVLRQLVKRQGSVKISEPYITLVAVGKKIHWRKEDSLQKNDKSTKVFSSCTRNIRPVLHFLLVNVDDRII